MLMAGAQQVWKGEFSASKELLQVSVSPLCVYPAMPSGMSGGGQRCPWSTCSLPSPAGVTAPAASPSTGGPRAAGRPSVLSTLQRSRKDVRVLHAGWGSSALGRQQTYMLATRTCHLINGPYPNSPWEKCHFIPRCIAYKITTQQIN